ncbi:hypothetical protein NMG60_11036488 [Bertholletia excelsa]
MVRIQVKHGGDQREFLYECLTTSTVDEIARDLTEIANLQSLIQRFALQLEARVSPPHEDSEVITLFRALSEAKVYSSQDQVHHNKPLSSYVLKNHIKNIEKVFRLNYQKMGFPHSNIQQLFTDLELLQGDTIELVWAGKKLLRGKKLCDYVGKNEKTKIMLRLQSPGSPSCTNSLMELGNK